MAEDKTIVKILAILIVSSMVLSAVITTQAQKEATFYLVAWYVLPPAITWNPFAVGSVIGGAQGLIASACLAPLYVFEAYHGYLLPILAKDLSINLMEGYVEVKLFEDSRWFNGRTAEPFTAKDVWTYFMIQWKIFNNFIPWLSDVKVIDDFTIRFYFNRTAILITAPLYDPKSGSVDTSKTFSYRFETRFWYQGLLTLLTQQISTPYSIFGRYAEMVADIPINEISRRYNITQLQEEVRNVPIDVPWCIGPFWPDPATLTTTGVKVIKNPGYRWSKYVKYTSGEILFARVEEQMIGWLMEGRNLYTWHGISPLALVEVDKASTVKGAYLEGLEIQGIWFNILKYPFNLTEVRQALVLLIDRKEAAKAFPPVTLEYLDYVTGTRNSEELPAWIRVNLYDWEYNPEKAYRLLESVGFKRGADGKWYTPDGKPFRFEVMCVSAWADWVSQASNLAAQWQNHGIDAMPNCVDVGVYSQLWNNLQFDVTLHWDVINPASIATAYTGYFNRYWVAETYLDQMRVNYTWPVPLKNGTTIYVNPWFEQQKLEASIPGTPEFWDSLSKLVWFWNYYLFTYPIWTFRRGWQVSTALSNFAELLGIPDEALDVKGYKQYAWRIEKSWVATAWYWGMYSAYVWMSYGVIEPLEKTLEWPPTKAPRNPYERLPPEAKIISLAELVKPEQITQTPTPTPTPTPGVTTVTVTAPVTITSTVRVTVPTTVITTVREIDWTTTIVLAVVLLAIGIAIGYFTIRKR